MGPILNMVKAIEFVSPHEVDVVFEANGEIFKRRALLASCSMTIFSLKVDMLWTPQREKSADAPAKEAAPT